MGLLIKLQNGDTTLKSLKFGHDRPGGGDSNQPYIKNSINRPNTPTLNSDFLLRGGISAPLNALEDVARLTKYFFDFKNPSGLLFTAKQNLLSRTAVKAEVAEKRPGNIPGPAYGNGTVNEGIYTPLSTIAEAGIVAFGGHLNKQGIDPTGLLPTFAIKKYGPTSFVLNEPQYNKWFETPPAAPDFVRYSPPVTSRFDVVDTQSDLSFSNRLLRLWYTKEFPDVNSNPNLYSYSGGPGSTLGIGNTNIKFGTLGDGETPLRTGINNIQFKTSPEKFLKGGLTPLSQRWFINYVDGVPKYEETLNVAKFIGASQKYGLLKSEIWAGDVENDIDYFLSINLDKYLDSRNGYIPRTKEQRKDDLKWTLPVGASLKFNSFSQEASTKKTNKDNAILQQKIDDLKAQQDEINKRANDPNQYTYQETTYTNTQYGTLIQEKGAPKYTQDEIKNIQKEYGKQWMFLQDQINELIAKQNQNNNTDYANTPIQIISSGFTDGLFKGPSSDSYETSIYLNSVYKPGSLTERQDIKTYNALTQLEIDNLSLNRETPKYTPKRDTDSSLDQKVYYDSTADDNRISKELFTDFNDLIDFNFTIVDPTIPSAPGLVLDFRAYIDSFSDTYNNDWKSQTYMGRAEKQYKYNSFDREISLAFTIVADNRLNLEQMYSQLNTLASSIAPKYTSQGYMVGVLHKLTVGNYVNKQYGILQGLTFEITEETPWQIDEGSQLPLYIKVSGIKFVPIHNFRPEVNLNKTTATNAGGQKYFVPAYIESQSRKYISQAADYSDEVPTPQVENPSKPRTAPTQVSVTSNAGNEVGIQSNSVLNL